MSNRKQKLRLWSEDPRCHWCKRVTILTNIKHIKGKPDPLMATLDHLISRFDPRRWLHHDTSKQRNVLACFECNQRRSLEETLQLPKEEVIARSVNTGFFKPQAIKAPVKTLEDLKKLFGEQGLNLDINNGQPKVVGLL